MVTKRDYNADAVEAARCVLIELVHLLGEYRADMVLVGGWVPEILFAEKEYPHVGSTDIDLALDHRKIHTEAYRTIRKLLLDRGYIEGVQPYVFVRNVSIYGRTYRVEVDLLAGEYEGTGKSHRSQKVQDLRVRKARGCDLAFEMHTDVTVTGSLPGGAVDSVTVQVATVVPFLIMKGMALDDRMKEKDAWDIYYCLKNFPGGVNALANEFRPHLQNGLVNEGMHKIAKHFTTEKHLGPKAVAYFEEVTDTEERARIERDAYEQIQNLLERLGFRKR